MALLERKPNPVIEQEALSMGFTELQSRLLGNRLSISVDDFLNRHARSIPAPTDFNHGEEAINEILSAIENKKRIWLVSDFDNDGVGAMATSNYLLTKVLNYPKELLRVQVTKRSDGYGLTQKAIDLMLKETDDSNRPDLLITMDLGSSNGKEVEYLKSQCPDMKIIITDHHDVPETGYPENIAAFINPNKPRCNYPDKTICGAAVVFFILDGVRVKMMEKGYNPLHDPYLALSYVASSTVADAVSMESPLNRFIVSFGTNLMNQSVFPSWVSLKKQMESTEKVNEITLGWLLGPMINATSRLGENEDAPFRFFSGETLIQSDKHLKRMSDVNLKRKDIQARLYEIARQDANSQADNACIIVKLNETYPGIAGVVAGRLMEDFKKPVFVLMPSAPGVLTGSARAPGVFFVLEYLRNLPEGTTIKHGGHKSVAGLSLFEEKFEIFKTLMNEQIENSGLKAIEQTLFDKVITGMPSKELFTEIRALAPFGQGFSQPVFMTSGNLLDIENISKKTEAHKRLIFKDESGDILKLNYFNAPPINDEIKEVAYSLNENHFRGKVNLQLAVEGI